jgi:hypothetical protein
VLDMIVPQFQDVYQQLDALVKRLAEIEKLLSR